MTSEGEVIAPGDIAVDLAAFPQAAPGLSIGYSGDWGGKAALLASADCRYSVADGLFPEQAAALAAAAVRGNREEADRCDPPSSVCGICSACTEVFDLCMLRRTCWV
ncbi:hypothetical protein [Brevundimonas naejangsanensis]|uniref:hypothetical protein n=1 Tax=Brevundimonas naejangsanensis TaxID=588932 RepID=UPI000462DC09|nr:hypothetical protein [Brevundimonas naejangsanensis]